MRILRWSLSLALLFVTNALPAAPPEELTKSLIFLAPFDGQLDAQLATDPQLCTAETLSREVIQPGNTRTDVVLAKGTGRYGDALRFTDSTTPKVTLYRGVNAGFRERDWSGTVSFWLRLDPDKDLKPGYCDPIQITDKTWNDASFFVDFDKDLPRAFRLGVFPNYKSWNPADTPWDNIAIADRPMVPVAKPPFTRSAWTHVAWTFRNLNSSDGGPGVATLYLNGESQGSQKRPMTMTWTPEKAAIMLGIAYIGDFDELAIFNRALSDAELRQLYQLPEGLSNRGDK
jgi:hypothetical protein